MQRPKKLLRASRACDFCHKRSIKCHPHTADPHRCHNCYDFDVPCTYERPLKRGRATSRYTPPDPSRTSGAATTGIQHQRQHPLQHQNHGSYQQLGAGRLRSVRQVANGVPVAAEKVQSASPSLESTSRGSLSSRKQTATQESNDDGPTIAWRAFATASAGTIECLVDVYLHVVYPIFPLFHQPTLLQKVKDQEYLRNQGCFASLMAACALASARQRDGALFRSITNASYNGNISSETFYKAAIDMMPKNLVEADGLDYMRACALLSITSIQYGDIEAMQLYLGHYFTLVGIHRFYDEANWPKDVTNIEVEERRRLYWSTYTLDVYSSIVWNGSAHVTGANARVRYPTEIEDDIIACCDLTFSATVRLVASWLEFHYRSVSRARACLESTARAPIPHR